MFPWRIVRFALESTQSVEQIGKESRSPNCLIKDDLEQHSAWLRRAEQKGQEFIIIDDENRASQKSPEACKPHITLKIKGTKRLYCNSELTAFNLLRTDIA